MSKSEAQIKNEEEVRRIIKERNYDFWDEPTKQPKKSKKQHILSGIVIAVLVTFIIGFSVSIFISKKREETEALLNDCISYTWNKPDTYAEQIECYEKYKTEEHDEKVAELTEKKTGLDLIACLNEASENYAVTDEERANAGTDTNALLILVKRVGSGIDAKMSCHNKYKTADYETAMNKLKADKSENEAYITDAENAIKYEQTKPQTIYQQPSYSSSVHCSSRSVGSSIYTDCY